MCTLQTRTVLLIAALTGATGLGQTFGAAPAPEHLTSLYHELHASPELSLHEEKTSQRMAAEMRGLGLEVTEKVGGWGVVAVLKNGPGKTVLVRTDLDALPVREITSLPFASKVRTKDDAGNEVSVMHACGHDMHMTCWVGTAGALIASKELWHGTVVFIGQPAEEKSLGASAMLDAGLFTRFPKPEACLALHCSAELPAGTLGITTALVATVRSPRQPRTPLCSPPSSSLPCRPFTAASCTRLTRQLSPWDPFMAAPSTTSFRTR